MFPSVIDMVRQKRPSGPLWTVDDVWKTDVLERMRLKGISRADLARRIDVDKASITVLFRAETKQSRLVPKIHKVLEMVDTTSPVTAINRDEAFRRLQRIWRDLSEKEREHLLGRIASSQAVSRDRASRARTPRHLHDAADLLYKSDYIGVAAQEDTNGDREDQQENRPTDQNDGGQARRSRRA